MHIRRHNLLLRLRRLCRPRGIAAATVLAVCLGAWVGCTPQKRYQTLNFFFDGVPDPSLQSAKSAQSPSALLHPGGKALAHQHKPFAEGNCKACHGPDNKKIDIAHVKDLCLSCHQKTVEEYTVMHAPVLTGDCLWCHAAHESTAPALLVDDTPRLCLQCHNARTLSRNIPEHLDMLHSCLDCHLGHGGPTRMCLRPTTFPTTTPVVLPEIPTPPPPPEFSAMLPATTPETQPVRLRSQQAATVPATSPTTVPARTLSAEGGER